jgi:hypothetical protein
MFGNGFDDILIEQTTFPHDEPVIHNRRAN